ncbi:MAG: F0F1 ATP synthase subunit epsilon [Acetobacter sp.]|nr:F0F1 ATP synthase subunit epsilon [Bacteroides sp.]MCM1341780.1 F0F1 ATP synthase subunit epsilon [Acetobacter sp.]MCM1433123.1 F0F1 ATP synthase subunit epsilon [Clostridiales bacterium]
MSTFKLKIIASNRIFFDGEAESLVVPHIDNGKIGFLANHENCIMPVETGEMKIVDANGKIIEAFVGNGSLEFLDNTAKLVCVSAELPHEIDARRAKEAKERAEEEMRQHHSQLEYHHSQANLSRAMHRLKVKNRHEI